VQQLLRSPPPDTDRADANLKSLIAQIDHAAGVIRRMRDFLRRGEPHVSTIAPRALLADALALAAADLTAKGVVATIDAPDGLPFIHGDAVQLQQVLLNLVRNSADAIAGAGRRGGRITVTARANQEGVEIAVADNGPGIAPEISERLFHPLTTSKQDGLGLGLSISASIVEQHGGRMWLQTGASGATELRFWLPCERQ
jgi:C4-dicarboxylate-specific signal transduction histidine kinase